jgi:hypothetical protein
MVYSTKSADIVVKYLDNQGEFDKDFYWDCGDDIFMCASYAHDGTIEIFPDISREEVSEYMADFEKEPERYEIIRKA